MEKDAIETLLFMLNLQNSGYHFSSCARTSSVSVSIEAQMTVSTQNSSQGSNTSAARQMATFNFLDSDAMWTATFTYWRKAGMSPKAYRLPWWGCCLELPAEPGYNDRRPFFRSNLRLGSARSNSSMDQEEDWYQKINNESGMTENVTEEVAIKSTVNVDFMSEYYCLLSFFETMLTGC